MTNYKLIKFKHLNSTNEYAIKQLRFIEDKTVIIADTQSDGYGRFKRKWISNNPNNLYLTIVLKPKIIDTASSPLMNLTQYMSVILCETIERYGVKADIKWANDVLINGKKITGILSEASFKNSKFRGIAIGIGVNLNLDKKEAETIDQPATSLKLETNKEINKLEFTENLLNAFFKEYEQFMKEGFERIKSRYINRCTFIGREILIRNAGKEQIGQALKINQDGSLQLKSEEREEKILIGDMIC